LKVDFVVAMALHEGTAVEPREEAEQFWHSRFHARRDTKHAPENPGRCRVVAAERESGRDHRVAESSSAHQLSA
jgi:hypothetical protein